MDEKSAFDFMHRHFDEHRRLAAETVLTGRAAPDEYHRLCGVIQGIDFAKDVINNLAKRMEDDDE